MQKNILIFGWSRAGKSTLAKRLKRELGHNIVNTAVIFHTLGMAYPQLEINPKKAFATIHAVPFFAHYFCDLALHSKHWSQHKFIADVELGIYDFDRLFPLMENILLESGELKLEDEFILIGLVNSGTSEEILSNLNMYDTESDWTYSHPNLTEFCKDYPLLTQAYKDLFAKYNFRTYETSGNREKVFSKIVNDIKRRDSICLM